jgi:hypothetical protein
MEPVELRANCGKEVEIEAGGERYCRYALQTHFVKPGENYLELVERYVLPVWQPGDLLSISEKVIALCQGRVVYKKDLRVGRLARFLVRFAHSSEAGPGVSNGYKMQFAINHCGALRILFAAFMGGLGKLFGRHGVFYKIAGREVAGLDGFYGEDIPEYEDYGIRIPENPSGVCDEIEQKLGVRCMIVDANDLGVEILGKGAGVPEEDALLADIIRDNPADQSTQLTPFILIRKGPQPAQEAEVEETDSPEDAPEVEAVAEDAAAVEEASAEEASEEAPCAVK